jgi:P pilus assembly chaperone PapD
MTCPAAIRLAPAAAVNIRRRRSIMAGSRKQRAALVTNRAASTSTMRLQIRQADQPLGE